MDTTEKLDMLAEYHSQKDGIESQKRALMDDVKIPAEVEAVVSDGMKRISAVDLDYPPQVKALRAEAQAKLDKIIIPEEIKALLAEVDRQRQAVEQWQIDEEVKIRTEITNRKNAIQAEIKEQTAQVYIDIEKRKREIEAEFSGKSEDVDKNIAALEAQIKAETKAKGETVKGKYFMAVYVKGRTSWNNDMLDGMISLVPQLEKARKVGEPSITLRHV